MLDLYDVLDIKLMKGAPFHPMSQSACERANGTLKSLLRVGLAGMNPRQWPTLLPLIAFAMHSSVHETTGFTPFELVYGFNVRTPIDLLKESLSVDEADRDMPLHEYVARLRRIMTSLAKRAVENEGKIKLARKARYDQTATADTYLPGELVYVMRLFKAHCLESAWRGPLLIEKVISPVDYLVSFPGTVKPSRVVHANMLRRHIQPE